MESCRRHQWPQFLSAPLQGTRPAPGEGRMERRGRGCRDRHHSEARYSSGRKNGAIFLLMSQTPPCACSKSMWLRPHAPQPLPARPDPSHPATHVSAPNTQQALPSRPHLERGRGVREQSLVQTGPPGWTQRAGLAVAWDPGQAVTGAWPGPQKWASHPCRPPSTVSPLSHS